MRQRERLGYADYRLRRWGCWVSREGYGAGPALSALWRQVYGTTSLDDLGDDVRQEVEETDRAVRQAEVELQQVGRLHYARPDLHGRDKARRLGLTRTVYYRRLEGLRAFVEGYFSRPSGG